MIYKEGNKILCSSAGYTPLTHLYTLDIPNKEVRMGLMMLNKHTYMMIQLNPRIESVIKVAKLDEDCMSVSYSISPIILEITDLLDSGNDLGAVELYAQLMASIAKHFIEEEHWQYFDDYYSPDYDCIDIYRHFNACKKEGKFSLEGQKLLDDYLAELKKSEACDDYGIPSVCYRKPSW